MTAPWTPTGDKWPQPAMVMIEGIDNRYARVGNGDAAFWVHLPNIRPMPPTITTEQQAVLDATERQSRLLDKHMRLFTVTENTGAREYADAVMETNKAVRALRDSRTSPDPLKELREAWHELLRNKSFQHDAVGRMADAVAALEAKS